MSQPLAFIGTYTRDGSKGIYSYRYNSDTGELTPLGGAECSNPSFLALHPSGNYLYAVCEISELNGEKAGGVSAFAIDRQTGGLTFLNQQSTKGPGPCHLVVDATGEYVLVANYGGGSVCLLPLNADESLKEASDFIQHEGSSVNPRRQQGPHAHSINLDAQNRFAYTPDLGMDKVMIYQLDRAAGKLVPNNPPFAQAAPGEGPRHFDFHPSGKTAYLINEIGNTVDVFDYNAESGVLTKKQSIDTLPDGFGDTSHTADIHVAPNGKFVYGSNRGHDSIVIYAVDPEANTLTLVGHQSTGGKNPRNFAIAPSGAFLLAANQDTNNIVAFRIDAEAGKLTPTGHQTEVPRPVCIKFLEV